VASNVSFANVLKEIKDILLTSNLKNDYGVRRIAIGDPDDHNKSIQEGDYPAILIIQVGEPKVTAGPWANHETKEFAVIFDIMLAQSVPNKARLVDEELTVPNVTQSQIADRIYDIFNSNKKLNNLVTRWSTGAGAHRWDTETLIDTSMGADKQIYRIHSSWIYEFNEIGSLANNI
jgi:hypothetical protein